MMLHSGARGNLTAHRATSPWARSRRRPTWLFCFAANPAVPVIDFHRAPGRDPANFISLVAYNPFRRAGRSRADNRGLVSGAGRRPFEAFLERQDVRDKRARSRVRVLVISIAIHVVLIGAFALFSYIRVDELFSRSVAVRVLPSGDEGRDTTARDPRKPVLPARANAAAASGVTLTVSRSGVLQSPRAPTPTAADQGLYLQALVKKVTDNLAYPGDVADLRASVTVTLDLSRDGSLADAQVKFPCPHPKLCEAALAAVRRSAPFPAHPFAEPWRLSLPVAFKP
jgi:TonB family protein